MALDVVGMGVYFLGMTICAETVAAGSGPRSEGVGTACGAGDCGGWVFALPNSFGCGSELAREKCSQREARGLAPGKLRLSDAGVHGVPFEYRASPVHAGKSTVDTEIDPCEMGTLTP